MHSPDDAAPRLPTGTLERRATRLAERERRRRSERFRWSLLGSTWVHMLVLLAFQCTPRAEEEDVPDADADLLVLTLVTEPKQRRMDGEEHSDAGSALARLAERALVVHSDAEEALRATDALADALPNEVDGVERDMAEAAATDVAEILAATAPLAEETVAALELAEADIVSALDTLTLLAAQADALAQRADALKADASSDQVPVAQLTRPAPELARVLQEALAALAPSEDRAQGFARGATASAQEDVRAPSTQAPPISDAPSPPDDVVADRPEPEEDEQPEIVEEPPVSEPEPEPERSMQRFVRSDDEIEATTPDVADFISGRDADDDRTTRLDVTAIEEGQQTEWQEGQQAAPAAPSVQVERGETADPAGQQEVAANEAEPTEGPRGGGRQGQQTGEGSRGAEGLTADGGAAAAAAPSGADARVASGQARTAAAGRRGQMAVAGAAGTPETGADGVALVEAPLALDAQQGQDSGWWRPMAARIVMPTAPSTPPVAAPAQADASPTRSDGVAPVERPEELSDEGGQAQEDDASPEPTEAERVDDEIGEAEEAPAVTDPIADLRADLGWGGIDRSKLAPRANPSGRSAMAGMAPTSQQRVLAPDVTTDSISYVQARGTEVGRYTEVVYEAVNDAWYALDLTSDDKAMGIQGDVTVVFHVHRNGRVEDLAVLRSSGHLALDQMALAAVPRRLPRIPREVEEDVLLQQITFHYRNPLVAAPARP